MIGEKVASTSLNEPKSWYPPPPHPPRGTGKCGGSRAAMRSDLRESETNTIILHIRGPISAKCPNFLFETGKILTRN